MLRRVLAARTTQNGTSGVLPLLSDPQILQKTLLVNRGACRHLRSIEGQDYDQSRKLVTSL